MFIAVNARSFEMPWVLLSWMRNSSLGGLKGFAPCSSNKAFNMSNSLVLFLSMKYELSHVMLIGTLLFNDCGGTYSGTAAGSVVLITSSVDLMLTAAVVSINFGVTIAGPSVVIKAGFPAV